jgi:cytochrome d ubiquinol oxidase subunit II
VIYPVWAKNVKSKIKPLLASVLTIVGIVGTVGASLFPRLVPNLNTAEGYDPNALTDFTSSGAAEHLTSSLNISNAASSELTLTIMLIIAGVGVPVMLLYTIFVYKTLLKPDPVVDVDQSTSASHRL